MIGWLFCSFLIKSRLWQDSGSQHEKCVFDADDLMHCISGLDKASLRPSAIFTFDIKSCQFLFVNFGSNVLLLVAGVGYLGINSIWPRGAPLQTYVYRIDFVRRNREIFCSHNKRNTF